ncbi:protein cereblon [Pelomyxa schiedti]|nr:protein cereblon [Pelomyxa schiedti]
MDPAEHDDAQPQQQQDTPEDTQQADDNHAVQGTADDDVVQGVEGEAEEGGGQQEHQGDHETEPAHQVGVEVESEEEVDDDDGMGLDPELLMALLESTMYHGDQSSPSAKKGSVTFDMSLPATHSYLGTVEPITGAFCQELCHGLDVVLPIFFFNDVVLFPGQTLPLRLFDKEKVDRMLKIATEGVTKMFGVVYLIETDDGKKSLSRVGTLAQVLSLRSEGGQLVLLAEGKRRFQIQKYWVDSSDWFAQGFILGECFSQIPAQCLHPYANILRNPKKRTPTYTSWPSWIYHKIDPVSLMEQAKKCLATVIQVEPPKLCSALEFSFWLAWNLPVSNETRQELLEAGSVGERIQLELNVLDTADTWLCCHNCRQKIAQKQHIFSMSKTGCIGTYVNPYGVLHDTVTLSQAQGILLWGPFSEQESWFPGYAWRIAYCITCHTHLGWIYRAVAGQHLSPEIFWGVRRSSVVSQTVFEKKKPKHKALLQPPLPTFDKRKP